MASACLNQLLNIVDLLFVGNFLGPEYLAAATLGNCWFNILSAAFLGGASLPLVVAVAAAWGWLVPASLGVRTAGPAVFSAAEPRPPTAAIRQACAVAAGFAAIWGLAYAFVRAIGPAAGRGTELAELFTQTTLLSFGGAYTVVPWALDEGVARGWLGPVGRADALAAGEATPGPLILVVTFIGFLAGWKGATPTPAQAGLEGAAVATLFAFIPSFAMVLTLAPFVRSVMVSRRPAAAMAAVGAVVVAAIAMLALKLARDAFLPGGRLDPLALTVAAGVLVALVRYRAPAALVVAAAAGIRTLVVLWCGA